FIPEATIPQEIYRAGKISFAGNFSGFINDFVAYGDFNSDLGNLSSDLNMKFKNDIQSASYSGNLSTTGFNLGKFISQDSLFGEIAFVMNVTGNGLSIENVVAKLNGNFGKFSFNDYTYQNIKVDGDLTGKVFKGTVVANDDNIKLNFSGLVDMSEQLPFYDFTAEIDSANFKLLNFTSEEYIMSAKVDLKMKGKNIDDIKGDINATDILFIKGNDSLPISFLTLSISKPKGSASKELLLNSPNGQINIEGDYSIIKLPATVFGVIDYYFPALPDYFSASESNDEFKFSIDLKNLDQTVHFFIPSVSSFDSTSITGHFSSSNHEINFNGKAASCFYQNIYLGEITLASITRNDSLILFAGSNSIHVSDSILITEPHFNAVLNNKTIFLGLHGASPDGRNYLNLISSITGDANQISMHILPSDIILNRRDWHVSENNLITYADERLIFKDFILNNEERNLKITNVNPRVRATNLQFDFKSIPILDFHELLGLSGIELSGNASGTATVLNIFNSPRISANADIRDLGLNEVKIKLVTAEINYIPEDDRLILEAQLTDADYDVSISGLYYPRRETDQLHLDLNIRKANLLLMQSLFFEGMISNTSGITTGNLVIAGNPDAPLLTGDLMINSLITTVDYLKTTYRCYNQPIHFDEVSIELGSLTLFDEYNDSARATGRILHDHLSDFSMNVSMNTKRFMALKTTAKDDSAFYGTAFTSGIIQFIGPVDQLEIRATVKSLRGTAMSIPVYSSTSLNKNSFIKYIDKSQQLMIAPQQTLKSIEGLTMNLNLELTPEAVIEIIFDEKSGDIIKGSGNGNIKMEIDNKGEFNMYGGFTIEKGNYLFTQLNFLNKYFTVEKGGTIVWTGNPYDAQINISAIYSTRASLYELVQGTVVLTDGEIKELKQRKKVDLYLKLNGSLFTPEISFDIKLPEETTGSSLANVQLLRVKQDEQEMNKQVF
ncbi:MAG: translocation/assembly module TamB, partial [Chitinophagales bacterium]|nr:translocation/assembly module TamB [Chitinophagales bacterium]